MKMRKLIGPHLVLTTFFLIAFVPAVSYANDTEWKAQVETVASELVDHLNVQQKFVVKSLSPAQTGLPEDFLRKLTNEIAAAILKASEFQVQLVNRFTTEELWSEAVEFGDADLQTLYEASKADSMIFIEPRLSGNGIEMNVSVYALIGESSATLIASSGNVKLNVDVTQDLGINLDTVDDSIAEIDNKLDSLEKMLAADKDLSGNQLSKIFFEFAIPTDADYNMLNPIDFAYLFKGCDAPVKIENDPFTNAVGDTIFPYTRFGDKAISVFDMKCEVYDGGELIVPRNIEKVTKLPIFLILHTRSGLNSIRVEQPFSFPDGGGLMPIDIDPFIEKAWCNQDNMASSGQTVYELEFPGREKTWLMYEYSSGSGGTDESLTLAANLGDLAHLTYAPFETYLECSKIDGTSQYSTYPDLIGAALSPDKLGGDVLGTSGNRNEGSAALNANKGSPFVPLANNDDISNSTVKEFKDVFIVANTLPPDDYLSLRTDPSAKVGSRITTMPNGTKVAVIKRQDDGWWFVEILNTGEKGWAKSGTAKRQWLLPA